MEVKLNSILFFGVLLLLQCFVFSQSNAGTTDYSDYKDGKQFEKYGKRRKIISAWQIKQLKTGALVVRLKTNKKTIDALIKQGNFKVAQQKQMEQYAINKNTMAAFIDNFKFCKVYFINSNSSDSLLKGIKSNIFLDSNLTINPSIEMNEQYYLLAERDNVYNSSIGFVKEDSAGIVNEAGGMGYEAAFVVKNKYGHQLKRPFPFYVDYTTKYYNVESSPNKFPVNVVPVGSSGMVFVVNFKVIKDYLQQKREIKEGKRKPVVLKETDDTKIITLEKKYLYENISAAVETLSDDLLRFYSKTPFPNDSQLNDSLIKPYLY